MAVRPSTRTGRSVMVFAAGMMAAGVMGAGPYGRTAGAADLPAGAAAGAVPAAGTMVDRTPTLWRPARPSREDAERTAADGRDAERARVDAAQDSFYADQSARSKAQSEAFENKAADYYKPR